MSMLGQTIDEQYNLELGMDTYDGQYYVYDRINRQTMWFNTLGQARNYFEQQVDYRKRLDRMKAPY